ncbi:hypothetical protein [Nocardioides sp. Kera G14]|uniref:hypothetical protein n=1 Tax=Nocardioides sp. Kera G14 TaxID=2884264 RepID=UPI001D109CF9|nr:hypothetical protein [Nocardioides sp. Kera G14]UDY22825.1 hypothetical protein LH076_12200 [Nocardioides sp. Kera G14]
MTRRTLGLVTASGAPRAIRASRAGWRDPRLWVGVAIVAVSVIAGARLMASADDTVGVSVARTDIAAGTRIDAVDLDTVQVKLSDEVLRTLIGPSTDLGKNTVFTRPVGAGELVPLAALGTSQGLVEVPLSVEPEQVPPGVRAGAVVDVYVLQKGERTSISAEPALASASVVAAPDPADALVATGKRQLVVAVPESDARAYLATVGAADQAVVTVVRRQ